ncbi:hypothetical protein LXL04_032482 [Taraxacum kok-saghyz]
MDVTGRSKQRHGRRAEGINLMDATGLSKQGKDKRSECIDGEERGNRRRIRRRNETGALDLIGKHPGKMLDLDCAFWITDLQKNQRGLKPIIVSIIVSLSKGIEAALDPPQSPAFDRIDSDAVGTSVSLPEVGGAVVASDLRTGSVDEAAEDEDDEKSLIFLKNRNQKPNGSTRCDHDRKGGLRTMPFIIVNEAFERVASYGLMPNMIFYLMEVYHMEAVTGTSILSIWSALSNGLSIFGALIADSYLGRFRVIALGSLSTLLVSVPPPLSISILNNLTNTLLFLQGMISLWLTSMFPQLRPSSCSELDAICTPATPTQLALLFSSLGLLSIGCGCIRPCSMAFGADQLNHDRTPNKQRVIDSYFNWYYASAAFSTVIAFTVVVYIQDQYGWQVGFAVPVLFMVCSALMFLLGSSLYVKVKVGESPVSGFIQVLVVAFKNRKLSLSRDDCYNHSDGIDPVQLTENLRFLNKSCVVKNPYMDSSVLDPWTLSTVENVESIKSLIRIAPIWSSGILLFTTTAQSYPTLQAKTMNRHITTSFEIPAASFVLFMVVTLTIWIAFYDRILVPVLAKHTHQPRGLHTKTRMGIGLLLAVLAMVVSAIVETVRRHVARSGDDMSALWLVPQYALLGLAEALNAIGQMEFYYSELPKSMSSIAMAVFMVSNGFSGLVGSFLVNVVNLVTSGGGNVTAATHLTTKLTSHNYPVWRKQVETTLISLAYDDFILGDSNMPPKQISDKENKSIANPEYLLWFRKDQMLLSAILGSCSESIQPLISSASTAREAWQRLFSSFASTSSSRIISLKSKLAKNPKGNRTITEFLQEMRSLADDLALAQSPVSEEDLMVYILSPLGDDYSTIAAAIKVRETPISYSELFDKLTDFERTLKDSAPTIDNIPTTVNYTSRQTGPPQNNRNHSNYSQNNRNHHHNSHRGGYRGNSNWSADKQTLHNVSEYGGPDEIVLGDGTDYYTKYIWLYPMKRKSDVALIFPTFKSLVEKFFQHQIISLFSDNGGEYLGLLPFLQAHGISHYTTPPHTPEQNGVAERRHRHIVETGIALLHFAKLPVKFWHVEFIPNEFPSVSTELSTTLPSPDSFLTHGIPVTAATTPTSIPPNLPPVITPLPNLPSNTTPPHVPPLAEPLKPNTHNQALKDPLWRQAMDAEFNALLTNGTWELVPKANHHPIGCKWIFRIKRKPDGTIDKFKARLVAKGFLQQYGKDYFDTFSPVTKPVTIRTVLSIALSQNWPLRQLDVNNAFLHGTLNEEVFMEQPPGFIHPQFPSHVCKLKKSLYGLKQAPRAWYIELTTFLLSVGFRKSRADPSLFVYNHHNILAYLIVYVDDFVLTGPLHHFLGVEVIPTKSGLFLSQHRHVQDLLTQFRMDGAKEVATPLNPSVTLSLHDGSANTDPTPYRKLVGSLQYLAFTRPDISFAVNKLSQFMHAPTDTHWQSLKRVLRYLKGTIYHGLYLTKNSSMDLSAFSDSDWGGVTTAGRSTTTYLVYLGPNIISWRSSRQKSVSRSSTEAEYKALANAAAEVTWVKNLLIDLGIKITKPPLLYCDNTGATYSCANPIYHSRMKHVALDYHFVREQVTDGSLRVRHVNSYDQLADALTKPLTRSPFQRLRSKIGVSDGSSILRGRIN